MGAAQSGSPTQDGQGEKAGGGQEMAVMVNVWQKFLIAAIQVNLCPYPSFTRNSPELCY